MIYETHLLLPADRILDRVRGVRWIFRSAAHHETDISVIGEERRECALLGRERSSVPEASE
jgi:hypothetical protein